MEWWSAPPMRLKPHGRPPVNVISWRPAIVRVCSSLMSCTERKWKLTKWSTHRVFISGSNRHRKLTWWHRAKGIGQKKQNWAPFLCRATCTPADIRTPDISGYSIDHVTIRTRYISGHCSSVYFRRVLCRELLVTAPISSGLCEEPVHQSTIRDRRSIWNSLNNDQDLVLPSAPDCPPTVVQQPPGARLGRWCGQEGKGSRRWAVSNAT